MSQKFIAGYGNTTSAIDAIKFQMSSGNIDAGQILLFGVKLIIRRIMHTKLVNGIQVPLTPEEIAQRQQDETAWNNGAFDRAMADLRQRRDAMLKSCDWVMMSDSPIADKTEWETYRQSLRDITR
jgi:hypothetical protein